MNVKIEPNTGKRILATVIDYTVIFAFTWWFIMTFGEPNEEGGKTVSGAPALMPVMVWFGWLVITEALWGATLGHVLAGLKVVSFDGERPTFGQALLRRLSDALEIAWCFGLIAFILVKNTQSHQRLGDIWAKTYVIDSKTNLKESEFEFEKTTSE